MKIITETESAVPILEIREGLLLRGSCHGQVLEIPQGDTAIGPQAFRDCPELRQLILPRSLKKIGPRAFCRCTALSSVSFSEGLQDIGESAFSGCRSLRSAILPDSLLHLESGAFSDCISLQEIRLSPGLTSFPVPPSGTALHWSAFLCRNPFAAFTATAFTAV